jgi:hypothetical protein
VLSGGKRAADAVSSRLTFAAAAVIANKLGR